MKYLIVSEGLYAVQIKELEAAIPAPGADDSSFLDTGGTSGAEPATPAINNPGTGAADDLDLGGINNQGSLNEPGNPGTGGTTTVTGSPLEKDPIHPGTGTTATPTIDELNGGAATGGAIDPLKIKKDSRQIVKSAIDQINVTAGEDPATLEATLESVIFELNRLKINKAQQV
jgi:hypothetical protein